MRDLGGSRDLAQLVETVPLGLIRQTLFEALYENSVPFCRALWLIRIVYLNLVKPLPPSGLPQTGGERGGGPAIGGGPGKGPGQRSFAFTQHLVEFLGSVLQEDGPQASPLPLSAKQQDEGGAAEKWSYALRLAGGAHREGIMDVGLLVDWLLERLHEVAGSGPQKGVLAEGLASLLLLTAKDLSASQALTRMAVKVIKETLRLPHLQPDASKPPSPSSRLRQTLVTIARRLLSDAPDVLCAVNLGKASDSSPFGPPGGPLAAVRRKTDALSSAVCPPVLEWDEAGAMAALEATMASGSLEDALNALPLRHGKEEAVVVVARWACRRSDLSASPSGGQANGDGEGEGKEGWGCRAVAAAVAARRLFACHLLQRTTEGKDKKRKDVAVSGRCRTPAVISLLSDAHLLRLNALSPLLPASSPSLP